MYVAHSLSLSLLTINVFEMMSKNLYDRNAFQSEIMNFEHNFISFNDYLRVKASDRVIMRITAANDIKTPS